ncbi:MAG: carboxypeptidase regulatory-like domain-containing protein, partial [Mariprofundus sp.]
MMHRIIFRLMLLICITFMYSISSQAASGLHWLQSQPLSSSTPSSIATPYQSAAELLKLYDALNLPPDTYTQAASALIFSDPYTNTDTLSRKVIATVYAANDPYTYIQQLLAHQNINGGFGELAGYESTVLDTASALHALFLAKSSINQGPGKAVTYLLRTQVADGSWANPEHVSHVYVSALAMHALIPYQNTVIAAQPSLVKAQNFLLSQRSPDMLWENITVSSQSLLALTPYVIDTALVNASITALLNTQNIDGSWQGNRFDTTLALQLLALQQARLDGTNGGGSSTGSISGFIKLGLTGQSIANANITIAGLKVQSDAAGYFVVTGLNAKKSYSIVVDKMGYQAVSKIAAVTAKQTSDMGIFPLMLLPQSVGAQGVIVDKNSLLPVANANVTLAGAAGVSYSSTTNAAGVFDFGVIASGAYTLSIDHVGYHSLTGALNFNAGIYYTLNQNISAIGSFIDNAPGAITGRLVDGKTGLPLSGVSIDLGNAISTTSALDGSFTLHLVPRGNYQISLSLSGYQTSLYSLLYSAGINGAMGTLPLSSTTTLAVASTLNVHGHVNHAVDGTVITNATATLVESGATVGTDIYGNFSFVGVTLQQFHVALKATGFQSSTTSIQVFSFGDVQENFVLSPLPAGAFATVSDMQGVVTDAYSKLPIAGAKVEVAALAISQLTDSYGHYVLPSVDLYQFALDVSAVGYKQQHISVQLPNHGSYTVNAQLDATAGQFQITNISSAQTSVNAHKTI